MFWLFSKCLTCDGKMDNPIKAEVKRPGYIGLHEKKFCSERCLEKHKQFIEKYEEEHGKISMTSNGGLCMSCYD